MSVRKRGSKWYVEFRFLEEYPEVRTLAASEKEAVAIEFAMISALQTGDYEACRDSKAKEALCRFFAKRRIEPPEGLLPRPLVKIFTLGDAVALHESAPKLRPTPGRDKFAIAHLVEFFGLDTPLKAITVPELKRYCVSRLSIDGVFPGTVHRELSPIGKLFATAIESKKIDFNPVPTVRKALPEGGSRSAYITKSDVARIAAECPSWFQDIIWIGYYTGLRKGEICGLRHSQIDFTRRIVTFGGSETKENRPKRVPLRLEAVGSLQRLTRVRRIGSDRVFQLGTGTADNPWEKAVDRLDWEGEKPRFHDLRHTWKANAEKSGMSDSIQRQIMGHKLGIHERYGHLDAADLVAAVDAVIFERKIEETTILYYGVSGASGASSRIAEKADSGKIPAKLKTDGLSVSQMSA